MAKRVIYKGLGFYIGLPARDMTLQEWKSYPKPVIEAALKSGIYEVVTDREVKKWH